MPALEAQQGLFRAAHTQVLGVSIDSHHCHANWARDLGGISFPLLSDFEPKGAVAKAYDLYLEGPGISDRATVLIDAGGVVRHASSEGPAGKREIGELVSLAEGLDRSYEDSREDFSAAPGIPGAVVYLRDACGASRAVRVALDNLHLDGVEVRNVSKDGAALQALKDASGAETAPCLVAQGQSTSESATIIARLANDAAPFR
ncbi:MAG: redoxin domain-containing protein [bacterium]|nr:redoxin domain-containing protein [bacterium]MCP5066580.1 redoxin domain-containing protein [bacterium]